MGQIREIFRSDSVHFGAPRQNVRNLIWKIPGFFQFGSNLAHFGAKSDTHAADWVDQVPVQYLGRLTVTQLTRLDTGVEGQLCEVDSWRFELDTRVFLQYIQDLQLQAVSWLQGKDILLSHLYYWYTTTIYYYYYSTTTVLHYITFLANLPALKEFI